MMISTVVAEVVLIGVITALCIAIASKIISNKSESSRQLPPGGAGLIPFIGETWAYWQHARKNSLAEFVRQRREKYGGAEVFWTSLLSYKMVVMGGPEASRLLFSNEDKLVKEWMFESFVSLQGANNLVVQSGERHRRLRRAVMPGLGPAMLQNLMTTIENMTKQHIMEKWHAVAKQTPPNNRVHAVHLLKSHILDLSTTLLLGVTDRRTLDQIALYFEPFSAGIVSFPLYFPGTRFYKGFSARTKLLILFHNFMLQRRREMKTEEQAPDPPKDVLSVLISAKDELGQPLSDQEILDLLISLLHAAHDTLVSSISLACKLLAEHPASLQQVFEEQSRIAKSKGEGEGLTWADLLKMNYMWMVVQETLRLQPSCFVALKVALKDFEYKGYTIPEGSKILHFLSDSYMDEKYFEDAKTFNPLRFEHAPPRFTFFPFGGGCHTCAGVEVARMFFLTFFHHLVTRVKWSLANASEKIIMDPLPIPADGLLLNIVEGERTE